MPGQENTLYRYAEHFRAELVVSARAAREYPWHAHMRHWTVGMLCSGTARLDTKKERRALFQGDSFVVPPNTAHALHVAADAALAVVCLEKGEAVKSSLGELLCGLRRADHEKNLPGGMRLSELDTLCSLAVRLLETPDLERAEPALTPPVRAVADMLREKPEEVFPLDAMASVAGFSRWHFLRLFRKETGLTPHAYQMICRLRLLRSLLRADTAMAEAAVSAGFADQSHMHKVFTQHHGLTPKQFRQAGFSLPQ